MGKVPIDQLRTELRTRYVFFNGGKGSKSSNTAFLVSGGNGGKSAQGGGRDNGRGDKSRRGEKRAETLW